ncbi:MAG: carbohydrate ABC transporter permease [Spirochaetia bacterium]
MRIRPRHLHRGQGAARVAAIALVVLLMLFVVFPFFWMLTTSVKLDKNIISLTMYILPPAVTFQHYVNVFASAHLGRIFFNTSVISASTILACLVVITPAAFAISILRLRGSVLITRFVLSLQMIPGIMLVVPLYAILRDYRMLDTYWGLIVSYTTFTIPFCFLLASSYYRSIPHELFESAFIDGSTRFQAMMRIAVPLSAPGLATTGIYAFLLSWNDFLFANTFTSSITARTLTVEVSRLIGSWGTYWGELTAGATVTVLPVLIAFLLAHRYIVEGLTAGAVKG